MTLAELPQDYWAHLPQIDGAEVTTRWALRWYDGPLSGVAFYRGQPCFFDDRGGLEDDFRQRLDEDGENWNDWHKRFVLIELTAAQYQEEARRHELFCEKVGTHNSYDEAGQRLSREARVIRSQEMWPEYYEVAKNWERAVLCRQFCNWLVRVAMGQCRGRVERNGNQPPFNGKPYDELMKSIILAGLAACCIMFLLAQGSAAPIGTVTVQVTGPPVNTFVPSQALGAGVDGLEQGDVAKVYTRANVKAMNSLGLRDCIES